MKKNKQKRNTLIILKKSKLGRFFLVRTFFIKTKQLGLIKTIRLFIEVHKIKKDAKKSGNIAIGFYDMYDNTKVN